MTAFVAIAAVLVIAALALLLWPLLRPGGKGAASGAPVAGNAAIYREQLDALDAELSSGTIGQEQWAASHSEIERRVLEDAEPAAAVRPGRSTATAALVAIAMPVLATALYVWLGNPAAFSPQPAADSAGAYPVTPAQIEAMIERLATKLQGDSGNTDGWIMLARSYSALARYRDSATAYAKATEQRPRDAQLLADYADALAMANGRKLAGEPTALIARSLAADPSNVKALALSGSAAFDLGNFKDALTQWKRILALVPPESEFAGSVRGSITAAEAQLRSKSPANPGVRAAAATASAQAAASDAAIDSGTSVQGRVGIAAIAAGQVGPEDSVFVFARAAEGPRMPLAVMRRQAKDLPFDFVLDDSMAMTPATKLSAFPRVVVVARISKSGLAAPQTGDLEAASAPLAPGTKGIKLEIRKAVD